MISLFEGGCNYICAKRGHLVEMKSGLFFLFFLCEVLVLVLNMDSGRSQHRRERNSRDDEKLHFW